MKKNISFEENQKRPRCIKLISMFYYFSGIYLFAGISYFISSFFEIPFFLSCLNIYSISFLVLFIFFGIGIREKQKWARIFGILISFLALLIFAYTFYNNSIRFLVEWSSFINNVSFYILFNLATLPFLIVHIVIGYHLAFNKRIKEIFNKQVENKLITKKESKNWYIAAIYCLIAGLVSVTLANMVSFIATHSLWLLGFEALPYFLIYLLIGTSSPWLFGPNEWAYFLIHLIAVIVSIFLGVSCGANYINKKYIIKNKNTVVKSASIYFLIFPVLNMILSIDSLTVYSVIYAFIAIISLVLFFVLSKKFIKEDLLL